MKRQHEISPGVYQYSTEQVGTYDMPQFIAECAYHQHTCNNKQAMLLRRITPPADKHMHWRGQLARAYAQYKQANKRVH